ncbi:MAG TPA: ABC transporter ATP-binding protein [Stellaceae bacterium]|jgi:ABC-2 type transport system ATP-binding protein|nr:ABC transporter ATP-binding protein [Stellaceae bacterium]
MSREGEPVLLCEDVTKRYGAVTALDQVSLSVGGAEFVALLGLNGAGKTTLFQLLSGLFIADGGSIRIHGHDIRRDPVPALAGIGIVFQQPTLDLDLTVLANLRFHGGLHGMPRALQEERIAAATARLGLAEMTQRKVRELSGGNRRRVELARALLHEPRLVLMDEPTVGLDPATRRELLQHVLRLKAEQGIGVLWATHLIDEAESADRVIILHRGKVLRVGTPRALAAEAGMPTLADAFMALTKAPERGGNGRRSAE